MAESFEIEFEGRNFRFPEPMERDHVHGKMRSQKTFYEIDLLRYLAGRIAPPGIAIDCGANIGNHTLFFAGVIGLTTIAVEPVARNYKILERALKLNGLTDTVRVVRRALDDKEGEVTMTLEDDRNFGMYKVGCGDGQSVRAVPLDILCRDLEAPVRLIKIDVEGYQDRVVRGAMKTLESHKPLISTELASIEEYEAFSTLVAPLGYVPVKTFNRTPTIVFCGDGSLPGHPEKVIASLRSYERRMEFVRPIKWCLNRLTAG